MFCSSSAKAHHVMGGELPSTFLDGILSGLGHPVIGLDHLAFIVTAGLIVGVAGLSRWMPVVFVAASIGGVFLHIAEFDLPGAELAIAASVVVGGLALASGRVRLNASVCAGLFALIGLFHGYAFGESIVGAEPTPLLAYLGGLAIVQGAIGVGAAYLASTKSWTGTTITPRLAGAATVGIGLSALMGQVVPG
jgi:urease accessory protein